MKTKLKKSDVVDVVTVCPYCMNDAGSKSGCCGESSAHFAEAFVTKYGDAYLISEVKLVDDDRNDQSPKMAVIKHESYNS